ncbi:MAG: ThuA domain-containing protein [Hyphomonadaceae bacterium]|nr:ThuA domain-containing protein [Hyphomonadaceae bacterium]
MSAHKTKRNVSLVTGGDYHDIDYARHRLLGFLLEHAHLRTRVFHTFDNMDGICASECLVTYTCNVVPDPSQVPKLRSFLENGGRWLALHGTNSWLAQNEQGRWYTPGGHEDYFNLLGSRFAAHPPIQPYRVYVTDTCHPVSRDCRDFMVEGGDELYYMHMLADVRVLMQAKASGAARGFVEREWDAGQSHPVLYEKQVGSGCILYFSLGHRRGHWDMEPLLDYYEHEEPGAWELPVFSTLMRRSMTWLQEGVK